MINAVVGTLIAWVLVRDEFPGKGVMNALIDLPFALPTIVAGLTLLALYGPRQPGRDQHRLHRVGVVMALLFVTLPFVVRAVQPVLLELDREHGAGRRVAGRRRLDDFRRIVLPNLRPAILAGAASRFARAIGEFGSRGADRRQHPVQDRGRLGLHLRQVESDDTTGAAAVSVVLLSISLAVLLAHRRVPQRALRAASMSRVGSGPARRSRSATSRRCCCVPVGDRRSTGRFEPALGARLGLASRRPTALHAFWLTLLIAAIAVPLNTVFGILSALVLVRPSSAAGRSSTR